MSAAEDCPKCESPPSEVEEFREQEGQEEMEYEERERRFDPAADPELHNIPHQRLIQFDPETQRSYLTRKCSETGEIEVDPTKIIIHLANAYNQVADSWALYFGPQSRYNESSSSPWPELGFLSEEKAEHNHLEEALEHIWDSLNATIKQVIIAIDSPSLFKLVTEDIPKMARDKNFREKGKGHPYIFHDIWKHLNVEMDELAPFYDGPLEFRFWLVPREMNQGGPGHGAMLGRSRNGKVTSEFADNMRGQRGGRFRGRRLNY